MALSRPWKLLALCAAFLVNPAYHPLRKEDVIYDTSWDPYRGHGGGKRRDVIAASFGSTKLAPELAPDAMGQGGKAWDRCSARN
jgi:hypothetical protein